MHCFLKAKTSEKNEAEISFINHIQCSKKETFRPGTGPEFSPNVSNPTFFHGSVLPSEFPIITEGFGFF